MSLTLADLRVPGYNQFGHYDKPISLTDLVAVVVAEGGEVKWFCNRGGGRPCRSDQEWKQKAALWKHKRCGFHLILRIPEDTP
jgi:hypothetical protein